MALPQTAPMVMRILAAVFAMVLSLPVAGASAPSGVVALVNGVGIPRDDFQRVLAHVRTDLETEEQPLSAAELRRVKSEVLANLIRREAAFQEGQRLGIQVSSREVDERISEIRQRVSPEGAYTEALESSGISELELRRQTEKDLVVKQLIEANVSAGLEVTQEDARFYYDGNPQYFTEPERVHLRHILLKIPVDADVSHKQQQREQMDAILQRLAFGEEFVSLAMELSEDTSAPQGGDIGFLAREELPIPIADSAFGLLPGQISEIITTPLGLHLVMLVTRQPESLTPFEDVRDAITRDLLRRKTALAVKLYLDGLIRDADVKSFPQ